MVKQFLNTSANQFLFIFHTPSRRKTAEALQIAFIALRLGDSEKLECVKKESGSQRGHFHSTKKDITVACCSRKKKVLMLRTVLQMLFLILWVVLGGKIGLFCSQKNALFCQDVLKMFDLQGK